MAQQGPAGRLHDYLHNYIWVLSLVIQLFVFPLCKILQKALEVTSLSQNLKFSGLIHSYLLENSSKCSISSTSSVMGQISVCAALGGFFTLIYFSQLGMKHLLYLSHQWSVLGERHVQRASALSWTALKGQWSGHLTALITGECEMPYLDKIPLSPFGIQYQFTLKI